MGCLPFVLFNKEHLSLDSFVLIRKSKFVVVFYVDVLLFISLIIDRLMDPLVLEKRDYEISSIYGGSVYNTKCILFFVYMQFRIYFSASLSLNGVVLTYYSMFYSFQQRKVIHLTKIFKMYQ